MHKLLLCSPRETYYRGEHEPCSAQRGVTMPLGILALCGLAIYSLDLTPTMELTRNILYQIVRSLKDNIEQMKTTYP